MGVFWNTTLLHRAVLCCLCLPGLSAVCLDFVDLSPEGKLSCRRSGEVRGELLQRGHLDRTVKDAVRQAVLRQLGLRTLLVDLHAGEERASLGAEAGALEVLCPVGLQ